MENKTKINFFTKIKIAIFKLEDYGIFLGERLSASIKYFLLLLLILSVVMAIADSYDFSKLIEKACSYIMNELPDFSYEDGIMSFAEETEAYDNDYQFRLIINTDEDIFGDKIKEYRTKIYGDASGLILLKDMVIYTVGQEEFGYKYADLFDEYSLSVTNKTELVQKISEVSIPSVVVIFGGVSFIATYLSNFIKILGDIIVVALFGFIASRICGIRFRIAPLISLSIYSLTLSILLTVIYNVVYTFTGFTIKYFDVMYLLIAYIYIIAAIMMIKYDLIKEHFELEKIIEVQRQVREENKEQEENETEENKKPEEKKEEEPVEEKKSEDTPLVEGGEPDGSEI